VALGPPGSCRAVCEWSYVGRRLVGGVYGGLWVHSQWLGGHNRRFPPDARLVRRGMSVCPVRFWLASSPLCVADSVRTRSLPPALHVGRGRGARSVGAIHPRIARRHPIMTISPPANCLSRPPVNHPCCARSPSCAPLRPVWARVCPGRACCLAPLVQGGVSCSCGCDDHL